MGGVRAWIGWTQIVGPIAVVACALAVVIGLRAGKVGNDITGFVLFGRTFVQYTHPPPGAYVSPDPGYDGQFFWIQAKDPLLLGDATVTNMRKAGAAFRLQRMAYPTLAFVLAAGEQSALPWTLLAINVIAILALTMGFALFARSRGWSGWWAVAAGLLPGLVAATLRDLSDPLAVASMLGGLMMWQSGRRGWAAGLLTLAVLAREAMLLALAAVAVEVAVEWWRSRGEAGALGLAVRKAWPVVAIPLVAFVAWQVYVDARYGGNAAATSSGFLPPFVGLKRELHNAAHASSRLTRAWDFAYLGLMVLAIGVALALAWRRVTVASAAAALFALSLLVLVFGDGWSYSRLSAPVLGALLLCGLGERTQSWRLLSARTLCVLTAAMTVPMLPALNVY
jgi:hypothetical protein